MRKNAIIRTLTLGVALTLGAAQSLHAVDQTKADNNVALDQAGSWVGNLVPRSGDRAIWDGTLSAANCTNIANVNAIDVGQIQIKSPSAGVPITIMKGTSNPWWRLYGINSGGNYVAIDMSAAAVDLNIGSGFTVQSQQSPALFTNQAGRTLTISGGLYVGNTSGKRLILDGAGNFVFSGSLSGGGSIIKQGSGALTISVASYNTNLTLNAGTVNLNHNFAINGNSGSSMTVNGGTIDNTSGADRGLTANPPRYDWNGDFTFAGTTNLNLGSGAVTLGGNRQVTVNNNTLTVAGAIGDGGLGYSLTKAGPGKLSLTGASTYTGNTIINGGTLALSQNSGQLASSTIAIGNGAILDVSAAGWSGNGAQRLGCASTSGMGTIQGVGGLDISLNYGDGLSFQAIGGSSPSVGSLAVLQTTHSLYLNDNTVTINVTGSPLGATTNTLLTVTNMMVGAANPVPLFTGLALSNGFGAAIITTSGLAGSIVLVVTNTPQSGEATTTTVARTTGSNPEIYGGQLDFTATVTGSSSSPEGNVVFKDGGSIVATIALTPGSSPVSTAVYTEFTDLKVAGSPHSITAYYQGNATHRISDSSASPVSQTVSPKALTYSGVTADPAVYDGTTVAKLGGTAALQSPELSGSGTTSDGMPYTVDAVSLNPSVTGVLAVKDVGNQPVTIAGATLLGTGAGNYSVLQQTGLVQTITPKFLTVIGLTATNKLYDGTALATLYGIETLRPSETAGTGTFTDGKPYTGDSVSLTGTPAGTFASTNVANNIAVTVTGLSLTGSATNNYSLTHPVVSASILGLSPGDQVRADNNGFTLREGAAWVSDTVPTGTNWAIWNGPYTTATLIDSLGTDMLLGGILISNVTGTAVEITGNSVLSLGGLDGKGIDMSSATVDLTISTARLNIATNLSFTVASNRVFTFANTVPPFAFNLNDPKGSHNLTVNGGGDFNFNGAIYDDTGNAVITLNGTGTCTLANANYVAHYVLNSGTLYLGNGAAVRGTVTINGGTVGASVASLQTSPAFNWNGDFTFSGSDLNLGSGGVTLGGNRQVTVTSGTLTVGGAIGDAGHGYSLTKAGFGTLALSGANTYAGNTTVSEGTLVVTQAKLATNSTVTVADGATLQLDFSTTNTVASLVLGGVSQPAGDYSSGTAASLAGAGTLRVAGATTPVPANITFIMSGSQLSLNWPSGQGWLLQSNSVSVANSNAWQTVTGAAPPFPITVSPATPQVFYRLKY